MELRGASKALGCCVSRVWSQAFCDLRIDHSSRPIFRFAAEFIAERMPASHVFVSALTDSGRKFRLLTTVGFESWQTSYLQGEAGSRAPTARLPDSEFFYISDEAGRSAVTRVASVVRDLHLLSGVSVPIVCAGRPWGIFGAYSECVQQYSHSKISLLKGVAGLVAGLVQGSNQAREDIVAAKEECENTVDSRQQLAIAVDSEGRVIRSNGSVEACGHGHVGHAGGQSIGEFLKPLTGRSDWSCGVTWPDLRERLVAKHQMEWELHPGPDGRVLKLLLTLIPASAHGQGSARVRFAVLVVEDITLHKTTAEVIRKPVTGLEEALLLQTGELLEANQLLEHELREHREAHSRLRTSEKQLHLLSCQLIGAQETERKRIAAELHDSLGQRMGVMKYQLESILAQANSGRRLPYADQLGAVVTSVRAAMDEVRKIAMDLRPSILDDLGLLLTIDWFCREFGDTYAGITIQKRITIDESGIPEGDKLAIFRIIQEAVNNVVKHACGTLIRLELVRETDGTCLRISDNGRGCDISHVFDKGCAHGLGLRSMRERAESTGGSFGIESIIGQGTSVQVFWPEKVWSAGLPRH